jgi:hypothetical protein
MTLATLDASTGNTASLSKGPVLLTRAATMRRLCFALFPRSAGQAREKELRKDSGDQMLKLQTTPPLEAWSFPRPSGCEPLMGERSARGSSVPPALTLCDQALLVPVGREVVWRRLLGPGWGCWGTERVDRSHQSSGRTVSKAMERPRAEKKQGGEGVAGCGLGSGIWRLRVPQDKKANNNLSSVPAAHTYRLRRPVRAGDQATCCAQGPRMHHQGC